MAVRPFSAATFQLHKTDIHSFMETSEGKHENEKIWLPGWIKPTEVPFFWILFLWQPEWKSSSESSNSLRLLTFTNSQQQYL
mgnify:CR=1 FL=1